MKKRAPTCSAAEESAPVNKYHRHPTSCSVRHVEESHAAGRQRIFFGPVPLADFQDHRHPQPTSRFTDRHAIGNRVLGGGYLLQKCVQSTPKADPWLRSKGWNPSGIPQRRPTHTWMPARDLLYDSCTYVCTWISPSEKRTNHRTFLGRQPHVSGPSKR